jgi:cell wall-associated NlpC family hydrolase
MSLLGLPYRWGGDDPTTGFDCSGLACEVLAAAGAIKHGEDLTAQRLHDKFRVPGGNVIPEWGSLAFFGRSGNEITHVTLPINFALMLEAGGGDSTVTSESAAAAKNAFVRVRPIASRRDFIACYRWSAGLVWTT